LRRAADGDLAIRRTRAAGVVEQFRTTILSDVSIIRRLDARDTPYSYGDIVMAIFGGRSAAERAELPLRFRKHES